LKLKKWREKKREELEKRIQDNGFAETFDGDGNVRYLDTNPEYDPDHDDTLIPLRNEITALDDEIDEIEKLAEKSLSVENPATIYDCDNMSPDDFEIFMKRVYEKMGYENVRRTPHSGDHGADLVMEKSGEEKTVVQTKRWKARITNDSVQEVLGAMAWYDAKNGKVVGTSGFTNSAYQEAKKSGIELIDRDVLEKLLEDHPTSLQKSQSISDITIDDICEEKADYTAIIRELIQYVLKDREKLHSYDWISADDLAIILWRKIAAKLVPKNKIEEIHEKILELLKSEYEIDLVAEKEAEIKRVRDTESVGKVDIGVLQGRPRSEVVKLSALMDTLQSLEGKSKNPVPEQEFVNELVNSLKFVNEDEAKRFIRKMINEASIYESTPGHYNTV